MKGIHTIFEANPCIGLGKYVILHSDTIVIHCKYDCNITHQHNLMKIGHTKL